MNYFRSLCLGALACALVSPIPAALGNWRATFVDNFNGTSINSAKWNTAYHHSPGVINDELQFYSPEAFTFSGGILSVNAVETTVNAHGMDYTSGAMTTLDKFSQTYGYYELRAKLPSGSGYWPAFWLLLQNLSWPPEIDIFEFLGHEMELPKHTFHFNNSSGQHATEHDYPELAKDLGDAWHTYGLLWESGRLVFYIDGVETGRIERPEVPSQPSYVLVVNAIGGSWPGFPNSHTVFPNSMQVDYVRVYTDDPAGPYTSIPSHTTSVADTTNPAEPTNLRVYLANTELSTTTPTAGGTLDLTTRLKMTKNKSSVRVMIRLKNSAGTDIATRGFTNQSFTKEVFRTFSHTFTLPAALPSGDYRVMVEINDEANGYAWLGGHTNVRKFTVGTPGATVVKTYDIAANHVTQGTAPVVNFKILTNKNLSNHHVHLHLYDEEGTQVQNGSQQYVQFTGGTPSQRTWTLPNNLPLGQYTFATQVHNTNWSQSYQWVKSNDAFSVVLDLNNYAMTTYAGQHVSGTAVISDGGRTLTLTGNTWRKIAYPVTVTAGTVLEFEFRSTNPAEIVGIGLDTDNTDSPTFNFQLAGSQSYGLDQTGNYINGTWKKFKIPVGEYYTGSRAYLTFLCDDDASANGNAAFRNIIIRSVDADPEVVNPGFETEAPGAQTITGWSESGDGDASFTSNSATPHGGAAYLGHWRTTSYSVVTSQTLSGLANGTYTLRAWVQRAGAQTTARMEASGYGGSTLTANIPVTSTWTQITISGINVTNGTCTIAFRSVAPGGANIRVDDVEFF